MRFVLIYTVHGQLSLSEDEVRELAQRLRWFDLSGLGDATTIAVDLEHALESDPDEPSVPLQGREPSTLYTVLDQWLGEAGAENFGDRLMALRTALQSELNL